MSGEYMDHLGSSVLNCTAVTKFLDIHFSGLPLREVGPAF